MPGFDRVPGTWERGGFVGTQVEGEMVGSRPANRLLGVMPDEQYARVAKQLLAVALPLGMRLSVAHQPVEFVYFPTGGMISVDALTANGEAVEAGVIGREGCAGVFGLLGRRQGSHAVIMQSAGEGLRARTGVVREEFMRGGAFTEAVHDFIYLQLVQGSQSVLCNRLHGLDQRMARWLLMASNRLESDEVRITQEYLAQMLGAQRTTVTVAAGDMQRRGLIEYVRGRILITDRAGLEDTACECYGIVRSAYLDVLGRP